MKTKVSVVALAALLFAGLPLASTSAYVAVSVGIAPPAIPIYQQPYCPGPGYIWTPGYWAWDGFGYYWVPGAWVYPPRIGFLWTPGYWGYSGGSYVFNDGYWGPTVGFYGGINYGFGYGGRGYYGGEWVGNTFRYNTAVSRVNTAVIRDTYVNREVVNQNVGSRAGFNGPGGAGAKPTKQEQAASKAERIAATSEQRARVDAAKKDPALQAKNNKGKPDAEAVKTFDRNDGRQAAAGSAEAGTREQGGARAQGGAREKAGAREQAGAGEHADAQKQSDVAKRSSAEKAKGETAQAAKHSQPKAQTAAGQSSQAKHKSPTTKKVAAASTAQHRQPVSRHPQKAKAGKAPPVASRGAPAHAEQPAKKKKKKHGEEGSGGGR